VVIASLGAAGGEKSKKAIPRASEHGSVEMLVPTDRKIPQGKFSTRRRERADQATCRHQTLPRPVVSNVIQLD
jgi:hypothetical protein